MRIRLVHTASVFFFAVLDILEVIQKKGGNHHGRRNQNKECRSEERLSSVR